MARIKETNQRKTLFPTKQSKDIIVIGIFRLAIHGSVEKRRTSLCAALRVSSCCGGLGILRSEKR